MLEERSGLPLFKNPENVTIIAPSVLGSDVVYSSSNTLRHAFRRADGLIRWVED
jgi:hypothetical protein